MASFADSVTARNLPCSCRVDSSRGAARSRPRSAARPARGRRPAAGPYVVDAHGVPSARSRVAVPRWSRPLPAGGAQRAVRRVLAGRPVVVARVQVAAEQLGAAGAQQPGRRLVRQHAALLLVDDVPGRPRLRSSSCLPASRVRRAVADDLEQPLGERAAERRRQRPGRAPAPAGGAAQEARGRGRGRGAVRRGHGLRHASHLGNPPAPLQSPWRRPLCRASGGTRSAHCRPAACRRCHRCSPRSAVEGASPRRCRARGRPGQRRPGLAGPARG